MGTWIILFIIESIFGGIVFFLGVFHGSWYMLRCHKKEMCYIAEEIAKKNNELNERERKLSEAEHGKQ